MHSPEVLAFSIKRPWPRITKRRPSMADDARGKFHWQVRLGRNSYISPFVYIGKYELYFPSAIDIWHMEPGGRDSLTVCKDRVTDKDGKFVRWSHAWKWHVWHWKVTPVFIYNIRRRLLTRCAECGGPDRKGNRVNHSDGGFGGRPKVPIWCGEVHLYHSECLGKLSKQRHEHDPRGCYACNGKAAFEFNRNNT